MDEEQLVKAGMEIMLRPVTDIAENALGLFGGDWLSEKRARNRAKLKEKTEEILSGRGVKLDTDPSPSVVIPLLTAAQDEGRDELLELWAALLAAASDPARRSNYRREFVDIAKKLEPLDAIILKGIQGTQISFQNRADFVARHHITDDQAQISFEKLLHLGLIEGQHWKSAGAVTPNSLAREFCRIIGN